MAPSAVSARSPARPSGDFGALVTAARLPARPNRGSLDCMFKQHGPAPLPADALAAALAPFGQSRMLPREAYVDPAVFDWEQRVIFSGWTCVGHAGDLPSAGSQKAVGSGANGVLLVRGDDDAVRALPTRAVTVVTSYWRAGRRPNDAALSAPIIRGRSNSTEVCAAHRGSLIPRVRRRGVRACRAAAGQLARLVVRRPER